MSRKNIYTQKSNFIIVIVYQRQHSLVDQSSFASVLLISGSRDQLLIEVRAS